VDVSSEIVEIRVTASALPLPPLLDKLAAAVGELLAATRWAGARLRIVVTDLDADVFDTAVT
jgi:hypothetical protein